MISRLIVILLLGLLCAIQSAAICEADESTGSALNLAPFEQELYTLGYDVFLANSNPTEAYQLAQKAVNSCPGDLAWRRRAAQSAEWSGKSALALEQWNYLAVEAGQPDAVENALRLARELMDYRRTKLLLEKTTLVWDPTLLHEYVIACEESGLPEDAVSLLENHQTEIRNPVLFEDLARLHEAVGNPQKALQYQLDLLNLTGITPKGLLKAASLAFGSRDLTAAYTIMSIGKHRIPPGQSDYWQNFADLAWNLQDMATTELSARNLLQSGGARDADYLRLIMIIRDKRPEEAYTLAIRGWRTLGSPDFLKAACELGLNSQKHAELLILLQEAEGSNKLKAQDKDAYYWSLVSRVFRGVGDLDESLRSQRKAMQLSPASGEAAAAYIWLLIDFEKKDELRQTLSEWQGRLSTLPSLREPFGAANAFLGNYEEALRYFQDLYFEKNQDPGWLAALAELMEQTGRQEAAFFQRQQALQLAINLTSTKKPLGSADELKALQDLVRVAMHVAPGDELHMLMNELSRNPHDETTRELVAVWAMGSSQNDLSRLWYWREYERMSRKALWVELRFALENSDRYAISQLISNNLEQLPYRDVIEGARLAGEIPQAETLAFDHFQRMNRDYLLDRQIRGMYDARAGGVRYSLSLLEQSDIRIMKQQLSLVKKVRNSLTLAIESDTSLIRHQRYDVLGLYPGNMQSFTAGIAFRHDQGLLQFAGGFRDGLSRTVSASLTGEQRIDSLTSLEFAILTGAEADDSLRLKIAGIKNEGRLALRQNLTARDILSVQVRRRNLYDQERNQLGSEGSFSGELTHRLLAEWPDTLLRSFGGYHSYKRTGHLRGKAYLFIPENLRAGADASFFVPESFAEAGLGMQIGQEGRTAYTRHWRPFVSVDAGWNSTSSIGYRAEAGVAGPVAGLDKLECAVSHESSALGSSESASRVQCSYRYYFD